MGSHLFWEVKIASDRGVAIPFLSPSVFYIIPKYPLYRHSGASRNPGFPLTLRNEKCKAGGYRLKKTPYVDGFIAPF
jgi:hypothetical protein